MTRMLFSSTPSSGNFHPVFALALAARDAGHVCACATGAAHHETIEAAGMAFFEAEGNPLAVMRRRYPAVSVPPRTPAESISVMRRYFGEVIPEEALPGVRAACDAFAPDVIVRSHLALAGWVVGEERGIPHVAIEDFSSGVPPEREAALGEAALAWRDTLGLPARETPNLLSPYLKLVPFPPGLRHPAAHFAPTFRRTQPLIFSARSDAPPPAWLDEPRDQPLVHASLGTINDRPELLRAIVAGLASEPLTLVLTTGRTDAAALGALPANVRAERYISHALLLPRCDAIVTHAGAGTLIASIAAGLPMVMVPIFGDQPPNAECAAAAGAGIVIDPAALTPAAVRDAMRAVLTDGRYRAGVRALQSEIAALPSHAEAVAWIAEVAASRAPLLSST